MERLPTAPTPEARANGNKPNMKANEVIKIGRKRARSFYCRFCQIHSVASPLYGKFDDQNGILGEQPDKHDQSDLEVDIVFQS
jgi:hypothetical protein